MKGKLVVIDGTDGSGKATQTELLVKNLKKAGYKVKIEDFPQYGQKSAGLVEEYLNGIYGTAKELGPYIPSIFYAVDRFAAKKRIKENLKKGCIVVSNRYVTASMGHQGGKIKDKKERAKYFKWLFDLEYGLFRIPKPDQNIILHVPAGISQKLVLQKKDRAYIKGKKMDIHEADLEHLRAAELAYLEMAVKFNYPVIECAVNNVVLSREKIAKLVWEKVKNVL